MSSVLASVSTLPGPAITMGSGPPTGTPPMSTTVSAGWTSRLTSLNGLVTGMQRATPGSRIRNDGSTGPRFPVTQIAVRSAPGTRSGVKPMSRIAVSTRPHCSSVGFVPMMTNMQPPRQPP